MKSILTLIATVFAVTAFAAEPAKTPVTPAPAAATPAPAKAEVKKDEKKPVKSKSDKPAKKDTAAAPVSK